LKLNIGCREDIRPGFENIDLYFKAPGVKNLDVCNLTLDYATECAEEVLAHSILEHLTYLAGEDALRDWCSLVAPNGTLSLITPDFDTFMEVAARNKAKHLGAVLYGDWREEGQWHKSCWQKKNIVEIANECGLELIEDGRWLDDLHLVFKKNG
jgi:predicted SAM-dependent methyltransferase